MSDFGILQKCLAFVLKRGATPAGCGRKNVTNSIQHVGIATPAKLSAMAMAPDQNGCSE